MDNNPTPQPTKWSMSRILGLLVLVSSLAAAAGGVLDFFHLGASGWFFTVAAFLGSITERAQGGKSALIAGIISGDVTKVVSADGEHQADVTAR